MAFRERIEKGFVITAEASLPRGGDARGFLEEAGYLSGYADAVGVPDSPRGMARSSPLALSRLLLDEGIEPVMHLACANRNRIALRSDLLGAAAMGIENCLIVTGDHPLHGEEPGAKPVFDVDSVSALEIASSIPGLFPGCVFNPWAEPGELHIRRLEDKLEAGAGFVMTQPVFDVEGFEGFLGDAGTDIPWIPSVMVFRSTKAARFFRERVPGAYVPDDVMERLEGAEDAGALSVEMAAEAIHELKGMKGVRGVNLMTLGWKEAVPAVLERAGV
ncbi:MAG: methylenetetrahydrofolate reductase [Euryarchaeota archaeon]|nr:methylenetetrahydrofolate reductase [Euryarchaeota archaeon]